jgi:hypothetical protein
VRYIVYSANHLRHKHVIQVIRDFHSLKIGPKVFLADMGSFRVNQTKTVDAWPDIGWLLVLH